MSPESRNKIATACVLLMVGLATAVVWTFSGRDMDQRSADGPLMVLNNSDAWITFGNVRQDDYVASADLPVCLSKRSSDAAVVEKVYVLDGTLKVTGFDLFSGQPGANSDVRGRLQALGLPRLGRSTTGACSGITDGSSSPTFLGLEFQQSVRNSSSKRFGVDYSWAGRRYTAEFQFPVTLCHFEAADRDCADGMVTPKVAARLTENPNQFS